MEKNCLLNTERENNIFRGNFRSRKFGSDTPMHSSELDGVTQYDLPSPIGFPESKREQLNP